MSDGESGVGTSQFTAEVRRFLKVRVDKADGLDPDRWVYRFLGADLVEKLVLDKPDQVVSVPPAVAAGWGVDVTELFAIGRANLRQEPFERTTLDSAGPVHVLHEADDDYGFFVAARLLLLDEEPAVAPACGALVAVPHRGMLAYHPLPAPDSWLAANAAVAMLLHLGRRGQDDAGPISDRVYLWRRDGELRRLPAQLAPDGPIIMAFESGDAMMALTEWLADAN